MKRLTITVTEENHSFLKWMKLNFNDRHSHIIGSLLDKYREEMMAEMTDYEREQVRKLRVLSTDSAFDVKRVVKVRNELETQSSLLKFHKVLQDPDQRKKLQSLIKNYEP